MEETAQYDGILLIKWNNFMPDGRHFYWWNPDFSSSLNKVSIVPTRWNSYQRMKRSNCHFSSGFFRWSEFSEDYILNCLLY